MSITYPFDNPTLGDIWIFKDWHPEKVVDQTAGFFFAFVFWGSYSLISFILSPIIKYIGGPIVVLGFLWSKGYSLDNDDELLSHHPLIKKVLTEIFRDTKGIMGHTFSWVYASESSDLETAVYVAIYWAIEVFISRLA